MACGDNPNDDCTGINGTAPIQYPAENCVECGDGCPETTVVVDSSPQACIKIKNFSLFLALWIKKAARKQ